MSLGRRIFAATYDRMGAGTEKAGLRAHRQAVLANSRGRVLEIGGGTGANLPFYGEDVEALTVTEPERPMARRLERRLAEHDTLPAELVLASAEELPFEDGHFDVAVSTLVLCAVKDQSAALGEIRRVLKLDGRLLSSSTCARRSHGWPAGRTGSMLSTSSWSAATATETP